MRQRFNVNDKGQLEDRNGNIIGRLTSLTLETDQAVSLGTYRGSSISKEKQTGEPSETEETQQGGVGGAREIWDYYVAVFNTKRQSLNATRTTIIRNALKVRTAAECRRAIDGLRASAYHNGQNDQQRKYLDIRYALSGVSKNESADERIDKMGDLAPVTGHGIPSADEGKIRVLLEAVRSAVQTGAEVERGIAAKTRLEEMGFTVLREGLRVWLER